MSTAVAAFGFGKQDKSAAQRRRRAEACLRSAVVPVVIERLEERRLLAAGLLDPSFNFGSGKVAESLQTLMGFPAYWTEDVPYNPDAETIDVLTASRPNPPYVHLHDVAVEPGGKVVVVGDTVGHHYDTIDNENVEVYDRDLWVARYNADGSLDTYAALRDRNLYGNPPDYFWRDRARNSTDEARAVYIEPQKLDDGRPNPNAGEIVVAGITYFGEIGTSTTRVWVGRWRPDFSTPAYTTFFDLPAFYGQVHDIVRQSDGKFVVVGSQYTNDKSMQFAMWRFNLGAPGAAISLDTTFGNGGSVIANVNEQGHPSWDEIKGAVVQADGKIVVVGYSDNEPWQPNSPSRFIVQRYNANGTVDTAFGTNGRVELGDFGGLGVRGESVALTPSGQIVVVGSLDDNANTFADVPLHPDFMGNWTGTWGADKIIVARIHAVADVSRAIRPGDLDRTFGGDGIVEIYDPDGYAWAGQDVAIQSDGKIVVAGQMRVGGLFGENRYGLARLTTNGNLDSMYGAGGRANFVSSEGGGLSIEAPVSLALQIDGQASSYNLDKAVVVGSTLTNNPHELIRVLTDNRRPVATTHAPTVLITHQADDYSIIVTYYDDVSVDGSKVIDRTAIKVYRLDANGVPQELDASSPIFGDPTVSVSEQDAPDGSGNYKRYVVTYRFSVDAWASADNGTYVVRLEPGKISDVNTPAPADALARELARFRVEIAEPDKTPPTVSSDDLKQGLSIGGRGKYTFTVTYTAPDYDESNPTRPGGQVDTSTIGAGDLLVTGPNGYYQVAEFLGVDSPTNGPVRVATYAIPAPKTYWNSDNNGEYAVFILAGQVGDDFPAANYIPEHQFATLKVAIKGADVRPTATLDPATLVPGSLINQATGEITFEVKYTRSVFANAGLNQVLIDASSLHNNNNAIRVTSPNGFSAFAQYVDMTGKDEVNGLPQNAESITVTYSIIPPDGTWDLNEVGTYKIALVPDAVRDSDTPANYVLPGNLGSFNIEFTPGPSATLGPISTRLAPGTDPLQFTVTFSHPAGVDLQSIEDHASDLVKVVGPGGEMFAVKQSTTVLASGDLQVTYHLAAPGGRWGAADNGTYTISLMGDMVASLTNSQYTTVGYTGAQDLGTFQVNVPPALTAATLGSIGTVTTAGSELFFTVTFGSEFTDDVLSGNDDLIRVLGPGGLWAVNAQYVSSVLNPDQTHTVTYRIPAPGVGPSSTGRWDAADNGSYAVWLIADGLPAGNTVASDAALGGFNVNVAPWQLVDGVLTINGTDDADTITLTQNGNLVHLSIESALVNIEQDFDLLSGSLPGYLPGEIGTITSIVVNALGGADTVDASGMTFAVRLSGGGGADSLIGGAGNDTVVGNGGADTVVGKQGNDVLRGNGGSDVIRGGAGDDTLQGGAGDDILRGKAGDDVLIAGEGADALYGNGGNDVFYTRGGGIDTLEGGMGLNTAQADIADDILTDIQSLLA